MLGKDVDDRYRIFWKINNNCNLRCKYCFINHEMLRDKLDHDVGRKFSIDKALRIFLETGKDWSIRFTGGEPFLYPGFIDLCKKVSKHYRIGIDTNFTQSLKIREFLRVIPKEKTDFFLISAHVEELERLGIKEKFVEDILFLKNKGYEFIVVYVLHPTLIHRFKKDYDFFMKKGIKIEPRPFIGEYLSKTYPYAYDSAALKILKKYDPNSKINWPLFSKGMTCSAGKNLLWICPNGDITRCASDHSVLLGNVSRDLTINSKCLPCKIEECTCLGRELVSKDIKNNLLQKLNYVRNCAFRH